MSLRKAFATSTELETRGVALTLGNTRITMLRTGTSVNSKYNAAIQRIYRENKIAVDNDLMSDGKSRRLLAEVFAKFVITDWETNVGTETDEKWVDGIEAPGWDDNIPETKQVVENTLANVTATLIEMEDLFRECVEFAQDHKNYRASILDEIAKN